MAQIDIINETTIKIHVQLDDAVKMVQEAASHMEQYASDVVTIFEKMPFF